MTLTRDVFAESLGPVICIPAPSTASCGARCLGHRREVSVHHLTPVGYPEEFPVGLRPEVAKARRPWRTLVHDETWGNPRQPEPAPA